jgi:hypothetical protein
VPIGSTGATSNQTLLQRYVGGALPACASLGLGGACGWTQGISYYGDNQNTNYNALQVTMVKTMTHGLSANVNYAYQRGNDAASGFATWSHSAVWGPDSAIRRNALTAYGLYKLPFGKGQTFLGNAHGFVNQLVSGFEFSPTFVVQSGLPFTLSDSDCGASIPGSAPCYVDGSPKNLKHTYSGFPGAGLREFNSVVPAGNLPGTTTAINLCNTTTPATGGFTCAALDTIGNSGRNTSFGPNLFNSDMSAMKNFTIRDHYRLQFRADAFNAFNHINFANPNGTIDSSGSAGSITAGPGPNGTSNPRQMQFTARIEF